MSEIINNEVVAPVAEAPVAEAPVANSAWYDSLPDELKNNKNIQGFKSVEELAKSYTNQMSLLGKKVSEFAAEDVQKFYGKLGRPDSPEGYAVPEDMPAELKESFLKKAFDAGLSAEQAKVLADSLTLEHRASVEAEAAQYESLKKEWAEKLQTEFGAAYDKRIETAKRAFNKLADEGLKELLHSTGLHEHPDMIKLFARIGKDFLESDTIVRSDADTHFGVTPGEANAKIQMKMMDPEFKKAYLYSTHPQHKAAVAEMAELYALASKK